MFLIVAGLAEYLLIDAGVQRELAAVARHKWAARLLPSDQRRLPQRYEVDCETVAATHPFVIAAFGQSNSANYGEQRYVPLGPVYDVKINKCYIAQDPLLGSDGHRGSVWVRLADRLIARGYAPAVVLVTFGVSASEIARWAPGGDLNVRIAERLMPLAALGFAPDAVLFHQGETDAKEGTSKDDYLDRLSAVVASVRSMGVDAPFLAAVASYCYGRRSVNISAAQRAAVDPARGIYAGPNTDELTGPRFRFDDCHFSNIGLDRTADLWMDAIVRVRTD